MISTTIDVHVMSSGKALYDTYLSAIRKYPMTKIFVFGNLNRKEEQESYQQTKIACEKNQISIEFIELQKITIDSVIEEFQRTVYRKNEYKYWFNVTPGPKPLAMCLFYISILVDGVCYYVFDNEHDILEFDKPQIYLGNMKNNPNYKLILNYLKGKENSECTMEDLKNYLGYKHGSKIVEGNYIPIRKGKGGERHVSPRMFTIWTDQLKEWGFIEKKNIDGRSKKLILTSKGRFTINFLE